MMTEQEKWQHDMEQELQDSAHDGILYVAGVCLVLTLLMLSWI